jgi:tetratricopeptide (TPR) repeat protein
MSGSFSLHLAQRIRPAIGWQRLATYFLLGIGGCQPQAVNPRGDRDDENANTLQSIESPATESIAILRDRVSMHLSKGEFDLAAPLVRQLMVLDPTNIDYFKTAAFVAGRGGHLAEAAMILHEAVRQAPGDNALVNLTQKADIESGRLFESIDLMRFVVEARPNDYQHRRMLIGLLGEGQVMEAIPDHLQVLIKARQFDANLLETVLLPGRRFSLESLAALAKRNPGDLRLRIAEVASWIDAADFDQAIPVLRLMIERHPDFHLAWGLLARTYACSGDFSSLQSLVDVAPKTMIATADWDYAVARLFRQDDQWDSALQAAWQAVAKRPNDGYSLSELTLLLNHRLPLTKEPKDQQVISDGINAAVRRQRLLVDLLNDGVDFAFTGHKDPAKAAAIAKTLLALGRLWEAEAWSAIAVSLATNATNITESTKELTELRNQIYTALSRDPMWQADVPGLLPIPKPLADSLQIASVQTNDSSESVDVKQKGTPDSLRLGNANERFVFVDEAAKYGIIANGHTGPLRFGPQVPLSDSLGCGLGLIDFNLDGRPDIYFSAAGGSLGGRDSEPGAMLLATEKKFVDVTTKSSTEDSGYGQGVAVGDYNQDGFDDLYLLNFGENRLYRNNGDGSFRDVTADVGLGTESAWSTSGAWIDLNQDGMIDLIVCNYIDDTERVGQVCEDAQGKPAPCSPLSFRARQNRCYAGTATGDFVDVTESWNVDPFPGRSLGILAGRLDGSRLGFFVANDMSANSYMTAPMMTGATDHTAPFQLVDNSFLSGLAVDGRGRMQASMGIAAEDLDDDGDLDLFVTGFDDEYHILYKQESPGVWTDHSAPAGLVALTTRVVGFETKAIDVDNDGVLELMVANGHLSASEAGNSDYAQLPDMFVRTALGKYDRVSFDARSEYFVSPHVGRCVAPLDVNHDGKSDLLVTHVTEPPALLINHTQTDYRTTAVQLIATTTPRHAVGTKIDIVFKESPRDLDRWLQSRQQFAGNGYMVSTESLLRFSFADQTRSDSGSIHWPDGECQAIGPLVAGRQYIIVQGQEPFECHE